MVSKLLSLANDLGERFLFPSSKLPDSSNLSGKSTKYISWADYYMGLACVSAMRSKDPCTQVGACIVDNDTKIVVGVGYNGMPRGIEDGVLTWEKDPTNLVNDKNGYVVHAEINALHNSSRNRFENCTIYTTLFPCHTCAQQIIQGGIKNVVYLSDKKKDKPQTIVAKKLFDHAKVSYRQHVPLMTHISFEQFL